MKENDEFTIDTSSAFIGTIEKSSIQMLTFSTVTRDAARKKKMKKCRYADKYKAIHPPKCGGKNGPCETCSEKWNQNKK